MAEYTKNYHLKKPLPEEYFDIEDQNGNMELLDAALGNHENNKNNPHGVTAKQVGALSLAGGTLSGSDLYMYSGRGRVYAGPNGVAFQHLNAEKDTSNYCGIEISSGTHTTDITNAFRFANKVDNAIVPYNIFGQHNMPYGSYIGNGDATTRTIEIGGAYVSRLLYIWNEHNTAMAFVTSAGAIVVDTKNGAISVLKVNEMNFRYGVLTISTSNSLVNENTRKYVYQAT